MYCVVYWARYVRKGEVKSGGIKIGNESASWILLLDSPFREITISVGKRFLARKGVLSGGALGLNTLCRGFLAIQHLLGCCILGETSQRRSAPVTKFSQPRA